MRKTKKVAVIAGCMLIYSSFAAMAAAEEANNSDTTLEEVVVTGSKLNPLKIPVKMTVITADEIKAKGAQDAAEALKDVAGLYVTSSNTKSKKYAQFRGSDANSTKVIVDGVMLTTIGDGRTDLSLIPADNIEKIEVIKGPAPVMYGTNAPGGIIFITTKNGSKGSSGSISIAKGSWDTETYSLSFGGDTGKVNYYFGVKKQDTDGYTTHSAEKSESYNGKIRWNLNPKASLTVFGSYSDTTKQFPNRIDPVTGQIKNYPGQGGTLTSRNNYFGGGDAPGITYDWAYDPIKQSYIGAVYDQKLSNNSDLSLKVYQSSQKSLLTTSGYQRVDWDGDVTGYELQHTIKTSRVNTATWGYSYEIRDFTEITPNGSGTTPNGTYNRGDYDYTGKSFYLQDVLKVNNRLDASFGYRHNETDDRIILRTTAYTPNYQDIRGNYSSNDPVLTLNYKLSENTALHGSIGQSYRSPNAAERSAPLTANNLLPEEALNREVGLSSSTKSGLEFDVTYFTRDITNMIKGNGAGGGRTQYYNIPDVDMHGFEAEISKKISPCIKGFANYSYTNAYDTRVKTQVSDIPYRKFSYGLNYAGTDGINANLAVNYVGAVRSMYSQGNGNGSSDGNSGVSDNVYGSWKTQSLPAYHVVDLKVSKTVKNTEYYVKVLNLFDKEYYQGAYLVAPGRYTEIGTTIKF
ncbi:Vitamin B12 transporter BtuB [Sporomusa silvacetica DSM 10669]|uniref:Vitamin B12 transporter BtuB n=1 Tax=Sporomusa silvacetica DSM 10669 TaxID=1123289 RepID=A0ABZ3IMF3_9FIRM|nr:TonB-dependent receptor [Sporomusa silvacetica]OZC15709.1 colicin I receptor precursor [Sporomusa silvacetica DSM 10669]